jgi:RNA polymerase sigma-70 factor (ECF subfamily)
MPIHPSGSIALPAPSTTPESVRRASPLEEEVVTLFDLFRDKLLRYLLSFGLPVCDGEEIVQEVFLSLVQHLQHGKSRQNLRAWLFRVAHNLALKRRSRANRTLEPLGETAAENRLVDPAPNPEDQLHYSQTQVRLMAVLRILPERDRKCLSLRAEGLRYREIAAVLDMSLGAVSLSLERSLTRLARAAER